MSLQASESNERTAVISAVAGRTHRSQESFLLDTSYVLPSLEVQGIDEETYGGIPAKKLHYPIALVAELVGVVAKDVEKAGIAG